MGTVLRLEDLEIWQLARDLALRVRRLTASGRLQHEFGLKQQICNASGSVMDNIAEGFGRGSKTEFVHFLTIAKGSLEETRSQLYRCIDSELVDNTDGTELLARSELVLKKISSLIYYLNKSSLKGSKFKDRN